jgi:hypothetical protein
MARTPTRQSPRHTPYTQSVTSDTSFTTPPPTRRGRGVPATSSSSLFLDTCSQTAPKATKKLPPHYFLGPTIPSPFFGTIEASLDAVLTFSQLYNGINGVQRFVTTLLEPVSQRTSWADKISELETATPLHARYLLTELFFLVTRTLLPEQIAENRAALARLYDRRKQIAIRLVLRYDMLREWKMETGLHHRDHPVAVQSLPPEPGTTAPAPLPAAYPKRYLFRRPLLQNVIPTLIAAPPGGFVTHGVRERMRHHVTDLDAYLVVRDEEAENWSLGVLKAKLCFVLLHWQWLRQNNDLLDDMEVHGWEELDGKADESDWIADDLKRARTDTGLKKEMKTLG